MAVDTFVDRHRRSARESFANCPAQYQATYLHGVRVENDATRRGDVFHAARSWYVRGLYAAKMSADSEIADEAWRRAITETQLPPSEYFDTRRLWLAWTESYELNRREFYSTEAAVYCKEFQCWLRFDETTVPKPDAFRITDAKTHWRLPTMEQLRGSVQTGMYLAGARILYPGFDHYELVYDFVRYNVQMTVTLSEAELDEWVRWVAESDEAIDIAETTGLFPARGGSHCGMCAVKCDLQDSPLRLPVRFQSEAEAQAAVGRIAARAVASAADLAALKAYSDANGPVTTGGLEYAHRPIKTTKYPAYAVSKMAHDRGLDVPLFLSATAVKPLVHKRSPIRDDVFRLGIDSTVTKFTAKKVAVSEADGPPSHDEDGE